MEKINTEIFLKNYGLVYFFSMATDFTKAALGAEGVGKNVDMMDCYQRKSFNKADRTEVVASDGCNNFFFYSFALSGSIEMLK